MPLFGKKNIKKPAKKASQKREEKKQGSDSILEIDRDKWPIKAVAIVEIMGKPREHVEETMRLYIEKMKKEKDIKMTSADISGAEEKEGYFSTFAEVEFLAKTPSRVADYCFDYMPSSIELVEPDSIRFDSHQLSNFFNDLQARLHKLDMLVKKLRAENEVLHQNANFILRNNILLSLKEKEKDLAAISKNIGIPEEKTKLFLDALVKQGFVSEKKKKYSLNEKRVTFSE